MGGILSLGIFFGFHFPSCCSSLILERIVASLVALATNWGISTIFLADFLWISLTILDSGLEVEGEARILELLCTVFCGGEDTGGFDGVEQCNTELIKVVFIQKFMRRLSYPQIDEPK